MHKAVEFTKQDRTYELTLIAMFQEMWPFGCRLEIYNSICDSIYLYKLFSMLKISIKVHKYRVGHLTFGSLIGYKRNLFIFFQKYGFIRNIDPFHLRMKHIIQMSATADAAVPHSINPISY